jgi:hypothetical protein
MSNLPPTVKVSSNFTDVPLDKLCIGSFNVNCHAFIDHEGKLDPSENVPVGRTVRCGPRQCKPSSAWKLRMEGKGWNLLLVTRFLDIRYPTRHCQPPFGAFLSFTRFSASSKSKRGSIPFWFQTLLPGDCCERSAEYSLILSLHVYDVQ